MVNPTQNNPSNSPPIPNNPSNNPPTNNALPNNPSDNAPPNNPAAQNEQASNMQDIEMHPWFCRSLGRIIPEPFRHLYGFAGIPWPLLKDWVEGPPLSFANMEKGNSSKAPNEEEKVESTGAVQPAQPPPRSSVRLCIFKPPVCRCGCEALEIPEYISFQCLVAASNKKKEKEQKKKRKRKRTRTYYRIEEEVYSCSDVSDEEQPASPGGARLLNENSDSEDNEDK